VAVSGLAGWVAERWIGCAAEGAVRVTGGATNVRAPRLPDENPRPARASASVGASVVTANVVTVAIAASAISQRWRSLVFLSRQNRLPKNMCAEATL
jgi:hypothetical protein